MTHSPDSNPQEPEELLRDILRRLEEIKLFLQHDSRSRNRVDEAICRAITDLSTGLKLHADEHYRFMRLWEEQNNQILDVLIEAPAGSPGRNGVKRVTGSVHIHSSTPERDDVSATIEVGGSRLEISEQHMKIVRAKGLIWFLAIAGAAATAAGAWFARHYK